MFEHDAVRPAYPGASKRDQVEAMFDRIAARYDRLNRVLSLGLDRTWRRRLVREVLATRPTRVLDVATGTADLALMLARAGVPEVVGLDLSEAMLTVGRAKAAAAGLPLTLVKGDGERLPFADGHFDAVTVAFGVRNFEHLERGVAELLRVVRPGGLVAVLELSTPEGRVLGALHAAYTRHVLPRIGAWVSGERAAYTYLPASVAAFPSGERLLDVLRDLGARDARRIPFAFGAATLYLARARP